ncbi:hypothetical protein PPYR_07095 [Photinus pyralis]|uniref:CN hydrolase domain-containing protein n=1 Tax=Photinus pyralis TaxID=7054 RepID=A0A5N4APE1_PHOPY|nr:vanin-like protein 1 [Photinus pyralis]XP_031341236.1 vanin-like protein 1 [Photinus pyralis]KAB0799215.1 hypothetical protein PPYR_07095 [Photinus pyralis]
MLFTSVVIFAFSFSTSGAKDSYKAAVLEHYPIKDTNSYEDLVNTAKLYLNYIEDAAREQADIIVFPEDGLTASVNSEDSLWASSTKVPNPEQKISPCDDRTGIYSEFLVEFSCASKMHRIYSVMNLVEAVENRTGGRPILYNSNVVFDRNGTVIARHRKINLYEEYYYQPGLNTITTFTTDFGVTFGTFICFDIFFQSPADDLLKKANVTDIAFSTSWYQELPFFIGNSVQHAYAVLNGVNFLASGMSDLDLGMGGSGIYSANGDVLAAFISGKNDSKLLIADVPKVKTRRDSSNRCHKGGGNPKSSFAPHINLRETLPARLKNHTLQSIDLNEPYIYRTVCGSTKFCCTFNAGIRRTSDEVPTYSYKLLAYDGVTQLDEKSLGFRQCAIIACANSSVESCGHRNEKPPTGIYFEDLSITGSFENIESRYMPLTVTYDLLPANHYVFCKKNDSSKVDVSMYTTRAMDDLMTFGILGRAFQNDNKPPGRMTYANSSNKTKANTLRVVLLLAMFYVNPFSF